MKERSILKIDNKYQIKKHKIIKQKWIIIKQKKTNFGHIPVN